MKLEKIIILGVIFLFFINIISAYTAPIYSSTNLTLPSSYTAPKYSSVNLTFIASAVGDNCTYSGSGDFAVDCSDNCTWNTDYDISGNLTLSGLGILNLNSNFNFTGSNRYIILNKGCKFIINSGGGIE